MPIPFILGGLAVATGAYGIKKGIEGKKNYEEAKKIETRAKKIFEDAQKKLNKKRKETNKLLEKLGELKISLYEGSLADFIYIFEKIHNIDFQDNLSLNFSTNVNKQEMIELKKAVLKFEEILGGGIAALGSGALAGLGALGGVSTLATASTGTAIASLSGAAATNATLAWLGGGSLAAGGFGMAGGMVVLGGIVSAPVLAISGLVFSKKGEEKKNIAYQNLEKAQAAAEEMDSACIALDGIYKRTEEFILVLEKLNKIFVIYIDKLAKLVGVKSPQTPINKFRSILNNFKKLIKKRTDYKKYSDKEKQIVFISYSIAQTIKNICDTPIIDKEGKVTQESLRILHKANNIMKKIQEV